MIANTTTEEAQKVALYAHALAVVRDPAELQAGFQALLDHIETRATERLQAETNK